MFRRLAKRCSGADDFCHASAMAVVTERQFLLSLHRGESLKTTPDRILVSTFDFGFQGIEIADSDIAAVDLDFSLRL